MKNIIYTLALLFITQLSVAQDSQNLILGLHTGMNKKEAVKELIQSNLNEKTLSIELNKLIYNPEVRAKVISDYKRLKNICKGENVSRLTAKEMLKTING